MRDHLAPQNARNFFTGRAPRTSLGELTALPHADPLVGTKLAAPSPRTPLLLSALWASGFGPSGLDPDPKWGLAPPSQHDAWIRLCMQSE